MAVIKLEPTTIYVWDSNGHGFYDETSYILTGGTGTNQYSNYITAMWFDINEIINVINASTQEVDANFAMNITQTGRLTLSMHKNSVPDKQNEPLYYTAEIGWIEPNLGNLLININDLSGSVSFDVDPYMRDGVTLKEALEHGFKGFVSYSGADHPVLKAVDLAIEIEGNWDNQTPSIQSPVGGIMQNINESITFKWNHNGALEQKSFELRYRKKGTSTWVNVSESTKNQSYTIPANALTTDEYEWQVRTTSEYDFVSSWSSIGIFNVADTSPAPVFVQPLNNQTIEISDLEIEWDSIDQHEYEIELIEEGNSIWSDSKISSNKKITIENVLENNTSYTVRLRINQENAIFSPWVEADFEVSYTHPAKPILTIMPNEDESNLRIFIENPTPTGTEPQATNQELFKREQGGSWIKLADLLPNSEYIDYAVASEQVYEYRVTVHGNNDTSTRSSVFRGSVKVDYTTLNLANDPGHFIKLEIVRDRSGATNLNATKKQFAGRRFPVTEFGETLENDVDIECLVTPDEYQFLIDLFKRQETLIYRDSRGRKMYATVASFSFNDEYKQYVSISTSFSQVDYKEGID